MPTLGFVCLFFVFFERLVGEKSWRIQLTSGGYRDICELDVVELLLVCCGCFPFLSFSLAAQFRVKRLYPSRQPTLDTITCLLLMSASSYSFPPWQPKFGFETTGNSPLRSDSSPAAFSPPTLVAQPILFLFHVGYKRPYRSPWL
jgi:hypothetical protein